MGSESNWAIFWKRNPLIEMKYKGTNFQKASKQQKAAGMPGLALS